MLVWDDNEYRAAQLGCTSSVVERASQPLQVRPLSFAKVEHLNRELISDRLVVKASR